MSYKRTQLLAGGGIPDERDAVEAGGDDKTAVGAVGGSSNIVGMALQEGDLLDTLGVPSRAGHLRHRPHADGAIVAGSDDGVAIGTVDGRGDAIRMPF